MEMQARVFPDLDAQSRGILAALPRVAPQAPQVRGRFAIAFSGAKTTADLSKRWAVTARAKSPQRLALTRVVLNQGRNTSLSVTGKNRRRR
jgi:hypothetical protein